MCVRFLVEPCIHAYLNVYVFMCLCTHKNIHVQGRIFLFGKKELNAILEMKNGEPTTTANPDAKTNKCDV